MKAIVITEHGAPAVLQVQERAIPVISADEVLIEVKAAGVNRPDVLQRKGKYPAPDNAPADIPGLEVAGIIKERGAHVKRWETGDKVCALIAGGGYAEYAVAHADHCLTIPGGLTYVEAASLPEAVFTVWSNVFERGSLIPGEKFLVHGGTSGIGITAIQLAKNWGAKVYATAGTDEKCKACLELGADLCINYRLFDFEKVLAQEGLDVILDMIGGTYFEKNINILAEEGRLVYINAMQGNQVELNIMKLMQKRITVTGSTLRSRDAVFKAQLTNEIEKHVWPMIEANKFKPVVFKIFAYQQAADAHKLMESSQHIGKIVLVFN